MKESLFNEIFKVFFYMVDGIPHIKLCDTELEMIKDLPDRGMDWYSDPSYALDVDFLIAASEFLK